MLLFDAYKMSSNNEKMRFLACEQVERCLEGLYPNTKIMPFGSSVNSFGKRNSDLDMCIVHNRKNMAENSLKSKNSRLVFHSKRISHSSRNVIMSYCSYAMQHMLPGCQVSHFFPNFSCRFLNPNIFFSIFDYSILVLMFLLDLSSLQEQVKKTFCYKNSLLE